MKINNNIKKTDPRCCPLQVEYKFQHEVQISLYNQDLFSVN